MNKFRYVFIKACRFIIQNIIPVQFLNNYFCERHPAPAAAGAVPPKNQGNRDAIYATAAVPIFDHVFFCSS